MTDTEISRAKWDIIVIGSGASGGMAAWNLVENHSGRVLMLDAGTRFNRDDFWTHVTPPEARERRARGERPPQFFLDTKEQPYTTPAEMPFDLVRVWGLGGKTNVWGRVSLRYSDLDFEGPARDGWEIAWPIRYADIAPYYDKVDQLIGVCGGDDDSDALPGSRHHMPAPALRCGEKLLVRAAAKAGITIVHGRRAVLTRDHRGFPSCHYCGACGRGCDTASFFNSADHLIPFALKTGRLTIRENAVAARILADDRGLASGVQYFDRVSAAEHSVRGRVIVLGASCVDSTRILLNSKSTYYPNGIGNGSGVIGKYLCEQVRFHVRGFLPELYGRAASNDDGIGGEHIYMPRFNHRGRKRDYLRGFGSQFWNTGCLPGAGHYAHALPGFGSALKKEIKRRYPAWFEMHPYGEVLPYAHNTISLDENVKDRYGIPVAKITFKVGENERRMLKEMYDTAEEIALAAGAELAHFDRSNWDMPGKAIHEHGTCRMGADARRSALNGFCQMHEVQNLFVVDGSAFPTATEKNPTLTILALAWRATDYLAEQMRRGDL